jgi:hypothetical protein
MNEGPDAGVMVWMSTPENEEGRDPPFRFSDRVLTLHTIDGLGPSKHGSHNTYARHATLLFWTMEILR